MDERSAQRCSVGFGATRRFSPNLPCSLAFYALRFLVVVQTLWELCAQFTFGLSSFCLFIMQRLDTLLGYIRGGRSPGSAHAAAWATRGSDEFRQRFTLWPLGSRVFRQRLLASRHRFRPPLCGFLRFRALSLVLPWHCHSVYVPPAFRNSVLSFPRVF